MNIPLYNVIQINYPTAVIGLHGNCVLVNHGDENGDQIGAWSVPDVVQPTVDQLTALQSDVNTINSYQAILNTQINEPLLQQLQELDNKTIRPLRENDTVMIGQLTTQAAALRAQLLPMTVAAVVAAQNKS